MSLAEKDRELAVKLGTELRFQLSRVGENNIVACFGPVCDTCNTPVSLCGCSLPSRIWTRIVHVLKYFRARREWKRREGEVSLIFHEWVDEHDLIMKIRRYGVVRTYRGSCTVWHEYPSGKRASSALEYELVDIWKRLRWEKDDAES